MTTATQLPAMVYNQLKKHFTEEQLALIDKSWYRFSELSFGRASHAAIVREARMVLACATAK